MARFIGDETVSRTSLAAAGVFIERTTDVDGNVAESVLVETLDPQSRFARTTLVAEPPQPGSEHEGMGAWHVNDVYEAHSVLDGEGLVEYVTPDGVVSVVLEGGDVMVVRGAEHRYLPLTRQTWVIRHGGGADAELVATVTDRVVAPFATV